MKRILFALAVLLLLPAPSLLAAESTGIEGPATVVDGDTLRVGNREVTLFGIDAPELDQTCAFRKKIIRCGVLSSDALRDLITGVEKISCQPRGLDAQGHQLAMCSADGFDIGRNMVHTGWALVDLKVSNMYAATEKKAKAEKRGLWRAPFETPWAWRQNRKAVSK